jgi:hypothetical protein
MDLFGALRNDAFKAPSKLTVAEHALSDFHIADSTQLVTWVASCGVNMLTSQLISAVLAEFS